MQRALVTGSSSGIGLATVIELAQRGYRVIATMRQLDRATALIEKARQVGVADQLALEQLDVAAPHDHVVSTIRRFLHDQGPMDVVINNAGIGILGPVETLPEAAWRLIMNTNFFGALAVMQAVLPHMRERRRGTIVNVSSVIGRAAPPGFGAYAAAKFALEAASEALRLEMLPYQVHVVLIEPGNYRTAITTHEYPPALQHMADGALLYPAVMERIEAFVKYLPTMADDPAEVSQVIADIVGQDRPPFRVPVGGVNGVPADEWIRQHLTQPWPSIEAQWLSPPTNGEPTPEGAAP